jgi:hypothetical protein
MQVRYSFPARVGPGRAVNASQILANLVHTDERDGATAFLENRPSVRILRRAAAQQRGNSTGLTSS